MRGRRNRSERSFSFRRHTPAPGRARRPTATHPFARRPAVERRASLAAGGRARALPRHRIVRRHADLAHGRIAKLATTRDARTMTRGPPKRRDLVRRPAPVRHLRARGAAWCWRRAVVYCKLSVQVRSSQRSRITKSARVRSRRRPPPPLPVRPSAPFRRVAILWSRVILPPGTCPWPLPESSNHTAPTRSFPPRPLPARSLRLRSARRAHVPGVRRPVHAREHLAVLRGAGAGKTSTRGRGPTRGESRRPTARGSVSLRGGSLGRPIRATPAGTARGVREDRAGGGGDARRDRAMVFVT